MRHKGRKRPKFSGSVPGQVCLPFPKWVYRKSVDAVWRFNGGRVYFEKCLAVVYP